MLMSDVGEERKYNGSKKSQEISGICMRLLDLKFSTKKSHKIQYYIYSCNIVFLLKFNWVISNLTNSHRVLSNLKKFLS